MNIRKIGLAVISVAALSPSISNATSEHASLRACARAFATSIATPGFAVPTYRVAYSDDGLSSSLGQFYSRQYTFDLQASDPKTGVELARASCIAEHGKVIALSSLPLDPKRVTLAAR